MFLKKIIVPLFFLGLFGSSYSQGPPITGDSPIMIGSGRVLLRNLTEIRSTDRGTFVWLPVMIHYLPSSNLVISAHLPLVHYDFDAEFSNMGKGTSFGDLQIMGKYQFFRKDAMAKTLRMVIKTLQNLPTGKELGIEGMSTGHYESYLGTVLGYETLKYGISTEIGYNFSPEGKDDKASLEVGFGLPLLTPTYPVNQLNLYFEYKNEYYTETSGYRLLFSQGVQYAVNQLTIEAAIQVPLVQDLLPEQALNYSLFFGGRYVF